MKQSFKNTSDYIQKREIFRKNLFYLFDAIRRLKHEKGINILRKAALIGERRETVSNWLGKGQYETLPQNDNKYDRIAIAISDELGNIIPLTGKELYSINIQQKYGIQIEEYILNPSPMKSIRHGESIVNEPEAIYSIHNGLMDFINDPLESIICQPSRSEIDILSRIQFPKEFKAKKEIYKALLIFLRQQIKYA